MLIVDRWLDWFVSFLDVTATVVFQYTQDQCGVAPKASTGLTVPAIAISLFALVMWLFNCFERSQYSSHIVSWGASYLSHVVTLAAALVLYIYDANCRPVEKELRSRCANAVVWSTDVANFTGLVLLTQKRKNHPSSVAQWPR